MTKCLADCPMFNCNRILEHCSMPQYKDFIQKENNLDFYFLVWCEQLEHTLANPWKVQQIVAQDTQTAAQLFLNWYDTNHFLKLAEILNDDIFIYVQDWRGITVKYIVMGNTKQYNYILRMIK